MPYDLTERFGPPTLRIRHYGYLKERIDDRDKHARNLELLHGELENNPRSSFTHFNIATEYVGLDDLPSARRHYEQGLELLREEHAWWELGYAPILVSRLCGVRRLMGDLDGSDALANELLGHFPAFTDLVFEQGLVAQDRGDLDRAGELFERCLHMGDAPPRYAGVMGRGSFLALGALALLATKRGRTDEAISWFERSLELYPDYLAAGLDLAAMLLWTRRPIPMPCSARLDAFPHEELTWYLFLGTAFYERGHAVHAERLMRRALSIGEGHPAARVGLLEALVTQRRYDDVELESGGLAEGTPAFLAAMRLRMLAAMLRATARRRRQPSARSSRAGESSPRSTCCAPRSTRCSTGRRLRRSRGSRGSGPCSCCTRSPGSRSSSRSSASRRWSSRPSATAARRRS